ncbi:MAG: hypothetical protein ACRENU_14240 [Gemmatimonadaceae bacterium]
MSAMRVELGLVFTLLALSAAAAYRWRAGDSTSPPDTQEVRSRPAAMMTLNKESLDDAALAATARNPFRLSRRKADVPFVPRGQAAPPPPAPVVHPTLTLKGIVGGPPWQAVVDGLPGQPVGTVVSAGNVFDKLVVRSVSRDSVVIQSPDTTWRLTLTKGNP